MKPYPRLKYRYQPWCITLIVDSRISDKARVLQTGPVSKPSEKVQDKLTLWRGSVKNFPAAALGGLLSILLLAECQIYKQSYTFALIFQQWGAKLCVGVTCAYRNYILGHEKDAVMIENDLWCLCILMLSQLCGRWKGQNRKVMFSQFLTVPSRQ